MAITFVFMIPTPYLAGLSNHVRFTHSSSNNYIILTYSYTFPKLERKLHLHPSKKVIVFLEAPT
jgi:hypothetical protein